jgi:regulator of nucleoside diphosphate kinase
LSGLNSTKIDGLQKIQENVVTVNSNVWISFPNTDNQVEFQTVNANQADFKDKSHAVFSPIAAALNSYKVKDEIERIVPAGLINIRIDNIIYQPASSGSFNL